MTQKQYDIIVIGAGSAGLSVGLFMNTAGFKVLMLAQTDAAIGGDCLNDGCVPSKALIHVAKIVYSAKTAAAFGLQVSGKVDIKKAIDYVYCKQELIRKHENAQWLREQGMDVVLGNASFAGKNEVVVNGEKYTGKKIVIATGSSPKKLNVPGAEKVTWYDNKGIFHLQDLPERLLVVGGGPIGIEMAQALHRLGSKVTVVHKGAMILEHDEPSVAAILLQQLQAERIEFIFNVTIKQFSSGNECIIKMADGNTKAVQFDAVFVAIGRELILEPLHLQNAGITVKDDKIVIDQYLRTTNKDVFVCGDIAGDLQFSHAAEFHARILINNFFSPFKKKLDNRNMSWVTFTDPELATFGLNEKQLSERGIPYEKLEQDFSMDDRAVVDNYQYGKEILFISKKAWFKKQVLLGGTMIAPNAGELVQELILANASKISINAVFNKVYPYPVAARVNQLLIVKHKEKILTASLKKLLQQAYKIFS
jgi:pyruvate/2-oxoglutarate dehydrogenase complex dihydrolipoamide dehydrogenase (E3) component